MSIDMIKCVKDATFKCSGQKFVMFCLADYADEEGKCWPSVALIVKYTGQAEKTVRTHLSELEKIGAITRQRQRREDGTLGRYNFYLKPEIISTTGQNGQLVDLAKTSGQKGNKPVAKSTAHCNQLTPIEPPVDRFEEFWKVFADSRGKQGAKRVWSRKRLNSKSKEIILGAKRYVKSRGLDKRYWKQAQGWLNDGRWQDGNDFHVSQNSESSVFGDIPDNTHMSPEDIQRKAGMIQ